MSVSDVRTSSTPGGAVTGREVCRAACTWGRRLRVLLSVPAVSGSFHSRNRRSACILSSAPGRVETTIYRVEKISDVTN